MKILFFGIAQEMVGLDELQYNLEKICSLSDLKKELKKRYPQLGGLDSFAFAINEEYATEEAKISNADIIAIIPPVSGG